MKKLNVCIVSLTIVPDTQDGSGRFIRGIYDYLKKQSNINVKLLTAEWNIKLKDPNIIQFKIIKKSFLWIPQFVIQVLKFLRNNEFDIIHGNGPKGSLPLLFLGSKKKFLTTIHDLGPYEVKLFFIPIEKYLLKFVAKGAAIVTTVSFYIRNLIMEKIKNIEINKIFNIYEAIDEKFKPCPEEANALKNKLNLKSPIILYIGRIALYKGVDDIISAYEIVKKKIPGLNLLLGGEPDFYMKRYYEKWKQDYKDVHFLGFIPDEILPYYYSMADLFITYSYAAEGFGLTPIEAIACGTPVICSAIPVFKEILEDNAIFVPPRNPRLLANEIEKLLKDEELRKNLIQKAQRFIKKYSWNSVGQKLIKIYEKLSN